MTVTWEGMDPDHSDHAEWVQRAGRCFADHDHEEWLAEQVADEILACEQMEYLDGFGDDDG